MTWWRRVLSSAGGVPSTKRHVLAASAGVLCLVTLGVGLACAWWINHHGDLGSGAVAALTFVGGLTAALAREAYKKPEAPCQPAPSQSSGEPAPSVEAASSAQAGASAVLGGASPCD